MSTPRALSWIKPWMVVAVLTLVAAGGATTVYFVGEAQHRRDRRDISRWEARALPAARDAETLVRALRRTMSGTEIARVRTGLRNDLDAITGGSLPEIVRPAVAAYIDAFKRAQAALVAVGTASFEAAESRAAAAFATARAAVQNLDCKARLPACSSL